MVYVVSAEVVPIGRRQSQRLRWGRTRTLDRDATRVAQIADVLAWAVERDIPLADALETLPFYRYRINVRPFWTRRFVFLRAAGRPFRPWFLFMDFRWSIILSEMVRDLREGVPLSEVFERYGRNHFPGHYIHGVEYAESRGMLKQALPRLAEQMSCARRVPLMESTSLVLSLALIFCMLLFSHYLAVVIVPRFEEVMMDLTHGVGSGVTYSGSIYGIVALLAFAGISVIWVWFFSRFQAFGDWVLAPIPFFGRMRRRFLLCEAAQSIQFFLESGLDLPEAAESAAQCSRSYWLQERMRDFAQSLKSGDPWERAFSRLKLGEEFDRWILQNAESEDPAAGFGRMVEWIHQDQDIRCKRQGVIFHAALTVFLAGPLTYVAVIFYLFMIGILESLM